MSILHTVNKSAYERDTLETCVRLAAIKSSILLIEDGVFSAMRGGTKSSIIESTGNNLNFYVLGPDIKARGLNPDRLIEGIKIIDYKGFVALTVANDKVCAWL